MKQSALALLAGVSSAVSTETLSALMQHANFGRAPIGPRERFDETKPFGQTSNTDSDIKRQFPKFANPHNNDRARKPEVPEHLEGEELIPLAVRNARAAIRDPVLAKQPEVRPLYEGSYDMEPIDFSNKKFLSPVFLVDPMFTMGKTGDENQLFIDNDFGGYKRPVNPSKWPIIGNEVQSFFGVGPDCTCKSTHKPVYAILPRFEPLNIEHYGHALGPVYEPQYDRPGYRLPGLMYDTMYRGDDYGGHNIPFPHPCPPMPHSYYEQDAFIDLDKYFFNMYNGIEGDVRGYTMEPHGLAGWSADKAYRGDTLMRWLMQDDHRDGYNAVRGYGNDSYGNDNYGGYGPQNQHGPHEPAYYGGNDGYDNDLGINRGDHASYAALRPHSRAHPGRQW